MGCKWKKNSREFCDINALFFFHREPASHVDLSMEIDKLQDPDEFFAAHERLESNFKLSSVFVIFFF